MAAGGRRDNASRYCRPFSYPLRPTCIGLQTSDVSTLTPLSPACRCDVCQTPFSVPLPELNFKGVRPPAPQRITTRSDAADAAL